MKRSRLTLAVVLNSILAGLLVMPLASAAGSVTLAPAVKEIVLTEEQASVDFTFSLTNTSSESLTFRLSAIDFGSLDESGGVTFINKSSDGFATKYGLKQWIRLSTDSMVLAPGEKKEARAIVDNRDSLAPGGHYGAILATPLDTELPENENLVAINPSLSVLVFLKKQGGENYSLGLQEPSTGGFWWRLPDNVNLRFQNTGNVHVVPRGTIILRDSRGKELGRGIINEDSSAILPENFRVYKSIIKRTGRSWLPGKYTLETNWRYDGSQDVQKNVVEFYYFGNFLYLVIAIFCIGLICIVVLKSIKRR